MIIKAITASCLKDYQTITIGRQMEDNHRQFVFDCSGFDEEVTSVELVHQRSEDVAPYPVTTASTDTLTWTVTDTDTAYAGGGRAELRIHFANGMAKTAVFKTSVIASITGDTVIPEPLQSWYDALIDYIDDHAASPEQIEAAVEAYPEDHPIPAPVTSVNTQTGDVVLTATDVGAYTLPSGGIPKTDLASSVQASLGKADTALQSAPVTRVDDKTGNVQVLPQGGATGQVLKKKSGANYDVEWAAAPSGGGVTSVNGQTGVVTLSAADVGAMADTYTPPVTSVNQQTGDVEITAAGLGALTTESDPIFEASPAHTISTADIASWNGKYTKPSGGIPAGDLASGVIPTVPAASTAAPADLGTAAAGVSTSYARADHVHKMPTASDLGAYVIPSGGIPKSDLASAVQTSLGKADTALQTAPVTSVNGATGAVVIGNATTSAAGLMSATDKSHLDDVYADYSSALTALGVI